MSITKIAIALLACGSLSLQAQQSAGLVGEVFASDATVTGSVILAAGGTRVASGSTVSAGRSPASLRLARGGEVLVCPGTSVDVTAATHSAGLLLSLSGGTIETHYSVGASADTIQTPDFRILFPGPGDFHFAVKADASGNACVRALDGNTASIVVAEMMGDGSYQVRPNEQITFSAGKVSNAVPFGKCGCTPAVQALQANSASKPTATYTVNNVTLAPPITVPVPVAEPTPPEPVQPEPAPAPVVAAAPPLPKTDDVQVQVDVPIVYSADAAAAPLAVPEPIPPAPSPVYLPANVYLAILQPVFDEPIVAPTPPPAKTPQQKRGFLGRLRSFFGGMFK